jgi:3-dehydroquinate synthase
MIIKSHLKDYEVSFCRGFAFLRELKLLESKFIVIDANVLKLYKKQFSLFLSGPSMVLNSTERNKTVKKALEIAESIMELPSKRNTVLVSIGGGIIQDVTGFAASILYRGIKWIFVPTTLLAQTDSCIGSKTSLNHGQNKNLLGTFFPPDKIYNDAGFIETLSQKDFLSGIGEMAKIAITRGIKGIEEFEKDSKELLNRDNVKVQEWVGKSLEVKKKFIEFDEFDSGKRKLLNFGHTFGHALERTSSYAVPHGQGVSIGMLLANSISAERGLISSSLNGRLKKMIAPLINVKIRKEYFSKEYIDAIKKDKKRQGAALAAILLSSTSSGLVLKEVHDVQEKEIRCAFDEILADDN